MGTSAQVCITTDKGPIYLYRHYDGKNVVSDVQKSLLYRWRWDDPHYLSRIIFEQMISGSNDKECGFGIGLQKFDNISLLLTVDCKKEQVNIKSGIVNMGIAFSEFIKIDINDIIEGIPGKQDNLHMQEAIDMITKSNATRIEK